MLDAPRKRVGYPEDDKLKRPTKHSKFDPIKQIYAIDYASDLRSEKEFKSSLAKADKYNRDPSDDEAPPRDPTQDPSRATLIRARQKADIVSRLLERREFVGWMREDAIRSIHLYSDASPVIGVELQGMLIDIVLKSGEIVRRVLPGSQLSYGMCGAISKSIAFLYAMWLTTGPEIANLRYAMSKMTSATTDNGVEVNLILTPDVLDAFYAWLRGTKIDEVGPLVNHDARLMHEAIRIIGFGHTMGGIMKEICEADDDWPKILDHLRALCRFFRNQSYREHIQNCLRGKTNVSVLDVFTAGLLKWWYETVADVIHQLLELRTICQGYIRKEMFPNIQDKELFRSVLAACEDVYLWRWMAAVGGKVIHRIEGVRHWSLVCCCPEHVKERQDARDQGKQLRQECIRASRRLGQVVEMVEKEIASLRAAADGYTDADAEGDRRTFNALHNAAQKAWSLFQERTKYLF